MSNKIVIYRAIIDDVMANVAVDFEEYGMDEDLLPLLQQKWESKLLETRVAEFARAPGAPETGNGDASAGAGASRPPAAAAPAAAEKQPEAVVKNEPDDVLRIRGGAADEHHPVPLPEPRVEPNAAGLLPGDEIIDSDLDDSDDELRDDDEGEDGDGEIDIVFCVYDKVQRVKNKWKTVFKDGMVHINGRDYLFAKCQGEFEW
ncbi:Transcription initiation factor IIA large subunit [Vanrija pseudolonga]|uniref:Transcription initiation factor IIA large subunit n=1 Tax=Vanrija pseudolonga TaxID=143232 RepID=A0AAF0XZE2_9TREE|nr:Transcription initiation factor IIA large subunit [Vanrija pseudolonga]